MFGSPVFAREPLIDVWSSSMPLLPLFHRSIPQTPPFEITELETDAPFFKSTCLQHLSPTPSLDFVVPARH
jgi:hypothetical protein